MKSQKILPILGILLVSLSFVLPKTALAFGPCSSRIPAEVSYYPTMAQCGGSAAIVLSGRLANSFSVVVRACDNGDRDPCYKNLDSCGTNFSSPFKVQKTIPAKVLLKGEQTPAVIHCLKESGNSLVYKMVRRITIKRVNPVLNTATDVLKLCLSSRTRVRNEVEIISTGSTRSVGNTGFNAKCLTQKYLGCNVTKLLARTCGH